MPAEDGWTQPGPGLIRVRFKCGHKKFLPKPTVYRAGDLHKKNCRECARRLEDERMERLREAKELRRLRQAAYPYEVRTLPDGTRLHVSPDCPEETVELLGRVAETIRERFGNPDV